MSIHGSITGNVGGPPETRQAGQSQHTITTFSVASSHYGGKGQDGKAQYPTTWVRCELWGDRGKAAADRLGKGDRVVVHGELFLEEWTSKDGKPGHAVKCRVSDWELIVKKDATQGNSPTGNPYGSSGGNDGKDLPF